MCGGPYNLQMRHGTCRSFTVREARDSPARYFISDKPTRCARRAFDRGPLSLRVANLSIRVTDTPDIIETIAPFIPLSAHSQVVMITWQSDTSSLLRAITQKFFSVNISFQAVIAFFIFSRRLYFSIINV